MLSPELRERVLKQLTREKAELYFIDYDALVVFTAVQPAANDAAFLQKLLQTNLGGELSLYMDRQWLAGIHKDAWNVRDKCIPAKEVGHWMKRYFGDIARCCCTRLIGNAEFSYWFSSMVFAAIASQNMRAMNYMLKPYPTVVPSLNLDPESKSMFVYGCSKDLLHECIDTLLPLQPPNEVLLTAMGLCIARTGMLTEYERVTIFKWFWVRTAPYDWHKIGCFMQLMPSAIHQAVVDAGLETKNEKLRLFLLTLMRLYCPSFQPTDGDSGYYRWYPMMHAPKLVSQLAATAHCTDMKLNNPSFLGAGLWVASQIGASYYYHKCYGNTGLSPSFGKMCGLWARHLSLLSTVNYTPPAFLKLMMEETMLSYEELCRITTRARRYYEKHEDDFNLGIVTRVEARFVQEYPLLLKK